MTRYEEKDTRKVQAYFFTKELGSQEDVPKWFIKKLMRREIYCYGYEDGENEFGYRINNTNIDRKENKGKIHPYDTYIVLNEDNYLYSMSIKQFDAKYRKI